MHEEPTTVVIQRYLEALPGDTATDPVVLELLERAVGRLHLLCAICQKPSITATVPSDAAGTGFRRPHRTRRPSGPARRARIGRSSRNRARSSASLPAVAYRLPGSCSRHF